MTNRDVAEEQAQLSERPRNVFTYPRPEGRYNSPSFQFEHTSEFDTFNFQTDEALAQFNRAFENGLVIFTTVDGGIAHVINAEKISFNYDPTPIPPLIYAVDLSLFQEPKYKLTVLFETTQGLPSTLVNSCNPKWFIVKTDKSVCIMEIFAAHISGMTKWDTDDRYEYEVSANETSNGAGNLIVERPEKFLFPLHWLETIDFQNQQDNVIQPRPEELQTVFQSLI